MTSPQTPSPSPLRAVLDAFESGCGTVPAVVRRTGLPQDVVDAVIDQLVRLGRVTVRELQLGCPSAGCGTCALAVEGEPGCGATGPVAPTIEGRRPALVTLSLTRGSSAR